jgi:hypothetical protein
MSSTFIYYCYISSTNPKATLPLSLTSLAPKSSFYFLLDFECILMEKLGVRALCNINSVFGNGLNATIGLSLRRQYFSSLKDWVTRVSVKLIWTFKWWNWITYITIQKIDLIWILNYSSKKTVDCNKQNKWNKEVWLQASACVFIPYW